MKKQFMKVLKKHLWEIIVIFIILVLMVGTSYYTGYRSINQQISQLGEEMMNSVETAVTSSLKQAELQFEIIFDDLQYLVLNGADKNDIILFLKITSAENLKDGSRMPDFMSTYGYFDGEALFDNDWVPDSDYDPVKRPWYIGAIQNKDDVYFTEPYLDAETGKMCISFSRRLVDNTGNYFGVLALDLEITRITDYIDGSMIDNQGYGVLISNDLQIIYHRNRNLIGMSLREVGGYGQVSDLLEQGKIISVERFTNSDGKHSIAFFRTIFSGWHVGLIVPGNVFFQQIYQMVIVLCILGISLIAMLAYIFVKIMYEKIRSDEKNNQKRLFVERISHELRTPVNAIIAMSDIAKNSDDEQKKEYCLEKINDASHYLLGIVTEALDMSKIEAGDIEVNRTDFCLCELMNRVTAIFSYDIAQKHQELNVHIGTQVPPAVISDMLLLTQVLTNLLSNAHKYTPSGGRISMSIEKVGHKDDEITLRFSVADNGAGISDDQISELLGVSSYSSTKLYGSAGLGLAITQRIVEALGGEIWAESEPGEGTRFIFDIPVRQGISVDEANLKNIQKKSETAQITKFPGKSILLVEDIEINREIVAELLSDTEVTLEYAENGREAVAMFTAEPDKYDLIFMDIQMPEMDGYTATAKIREMDAVQARNIPIVAMTANVFKEDAEHCIMAGMNGHIGKPISKNEVLLAMQEFIVMQVTSPDDDM